MTPRSQTLVKFHTSLLIAYGLAISANAQTPLGSNGQVLNHCDHQCDRKLTKDKDGNYLFEQTKTKNTCDNANLSGTKETDGKSEKVDLKCKCRIIGTYHPAKAKKKPEPAEGDKYAYAGHVDGDQADLGVNTITKDNYSELEEHGWVLSIACIGTSGNAAVYKDNPKKKEKPKDKDKP